MRIDEGKFPSLFCKGLIIKKPWLSIKDKEILEDIVDVAKQNVFYIASTIIDNVAESYNKLLPFRNELSDSCRGLLLIINGSPHCLLYMLTNHPERLMIMGQIHSLGKGLEIGELFGGFIPKEDKLSFCSYEVFKSKDWIVNETIKLILASELFIQHAEIQTKEIKPSRQIMDGQTCLYNNKTKVPITVIDSAWFTNLISSGAFKVRGHFRMQACGENHSKRRLVWINDFEKDGYTRKAKKIKE